MCGRTVGVLLNNKYINEENQFFINSVEAEILNSEIVKQLQKKTEDLEKELEKANRTINSLKNKMNVTDIKLRKALRRCSKNQALRMAEVRLRTNVNKIFSSAQIRKLESDKNVMWSTADIIKSFALISLSKKAYETVRCVWKIPLPSPATLYSWASKFKTFSPESLKDVTTKLKVEDQDQGT